MAKQTCGRRIKIALEIRNTTQTELSKMTGIPKSAISQYIKGSFEPRQDRVYLISKALCVSEAWLMGYDVPMQNEVASLTDKEVKIITAYRLHPEMHSAVDTLLGLEDSKNVQVVKIAARNGASIEERPLTDSEIELFTNGKEWHGDDEL